MDVEIGCPFAGPLFAAGYIFLKTDLGAVNAFPYKATFVPLGNGISPKVTRPMQAFQFIEPFAPINKT